MTRQVGRVKGERLGTSQPRRLVDLLDGNQTKGIWGGWVGKDKDGGSANALREVEMRMWETKSGADEGGQTQNSRRDAWETPNIDRVSSTQH